MLSVLGIKLKCPAEASGAPVDDVTVSVTASKPGRQPAAAPAVKPAARKQRTATDRGEPAFEFVTRTRGRQLIEPAAIDAMRRATLDPRQFARHYSVDPGGRVALRTLPRTAGQVQDALLLLLYGMLTLRGEWTITGVALVAAARGSSLRLARVPRDFADHGLAGKSFPWAAIYSDGAQLHEERLLAPRDPAVVLLDFQYQTNPEKRTGDLWIQASAADSRRDRVIWVCGSPGDLAGTLRELARSRYMVRRYENRVRSLPRDRQLQVYAEQGRLDGLESKAQDAVAAVFLAGEIYYRGRPLDKHHLGSTFGTLVPRLGEIVLPTLYDRYVDVAVAPGELAQLLEPQLSGPSHKFMSGGLGILDLDAGKYVWTCAGEVPSRVARLVRDSQGIAGGPLLARFGGPPYGYPPDMVKAALAGLLRAEKIRIRPDAGPEITSIRDPGARDVFRKDRDLKRADILPADEVVISARDRVAICRFFSDHLHVELDRESDAIADAVFQHFPRQQQRLRDLEADYLQLPDRHGLPGALARLAPALDACKRSRHVEATVIAVRENLDALRDGIQQLGILRSELSAQAVAAVIAAGRLLARQVRQLEEAGELGEAAAGAEAVRDQLASERPWREIARLEPRIAAVESRYREARLALIERHEQQAEEARLRLEQRQGFADLSGEQAHRVLRPIRGALYETSDDDHQPSLVQLRDSGAARLAAAERQAHELLDRELAKDSAVQVVKLPLKLSGEEVASERQVDVLLEQLRERIVAQLGPNTRVRLI